ncbi:hypothetical protein POPTR_007G061901v4 [Populus trichocarpa]|uniref:Uncharacterized protein n=1 Tax=Populus trichocarpa TaxID=3694 RepID=A0ACC0SPK6_POPTR|nr:hypothetical protein POPTR_007G061901v4 [Populus trichocarpa]
MRDFSWIRSFPFFGSFFGPSEKDSKPSRKQARENEGAPGGKRLSIIVARLPNRQLLKYQRLLSLAFISGLFTTSYQRCFRDLTLSTPGANLLSVLPSRRRTRARVEPFLSGVTAVERNKILRSRNIRAGSTVNSAKI